MRPSEVREALEDMNRDSDGPCEIAIFGDVDDCGCTDVAIGFIGRNGEPYPDPVVTLPGDGKPFAVRAFVEALLCSEVIPNR